MKASRVIAIATLVTALLIVVGLVAACGSDEGEIRHFLRSRKEGFQASINFTRQLTFIRPNKFRRQE